MRILIADEDACSCDALQKQLTKWGHEVVVAPDSPEAWRHIESDNPPTLVLLGRTVPHMETADICRRIRRTLGETYCYIVLLIGENRRDEISVGINAGADDYITKSFSYQDLSLRIRAGDRIVKLRKTLQREASTDSLTGLRNRMAIQGILQRELHRSQRMNTPMGVALVDIDYFKRFNDTYGHLAGDDCLKEVALRLQSSLRTYDSIGRLGGEEFLIVLPGCSVDAATAIAERLRASIADTPVAVMGHKRPGDNKCRRRLHWK